MLWAWVSRVWRAWPWAVHIVKPQTVIAWHRPGIRCFDLEKPTAHRTTERAKRDSHLIEELADANPHWGAPRMHGQLLKLGISVSQSTVATYMRRNPRPPSQT